MTQIRNFREVAQKLGKRTMLAIIAMLIVGAVNAQKPKLAVMDFMAGVGLYQNDVNGLSDMLINSLFNTGRFELIERGQLCQLIGETNLQKSSLSAGQLHELAIKGVNFLLLGTANLTGGEYNVDVRVVDVGTGQLYSTAGVTKLSGQTYRDMMPKLANELATKLPQTVNTTITVIPAPEKQKEHIVILYNYLRVYPEDLGTFSSYPHNIVKAINDDISYGYSTWRLPTEEELSLINNNREKVQGMSSSGYMTIDGSNSGRVRLVTNRETQEERNKIVEDYQNKYPFDKIYDGKNLYTRADSTSVALLDYYLPFIISAYPKLSECYIFLVAQEYADRKEYGTAIVYLKQVIDIQPDYDEAFRLLAHIYLTDYESTGNSQSYEFVKHYAKQGARFGNKICIDWCKSQNISW